MWKILGLVVLCGLLSASEGKPYASRSCTNSRESAKFIISAMLHDGLLLNHLKGISLSDVNFGELLDQANSITGLRIGNLEVTSYEGALVPSGLDVSLSVCLNIIGHTLLDPSNLVSLSLEVTFRVKYERTNFQNGSLDIIFHECGANFGAITTTLLSSTLSASLLDKIQDSIIADINLQICGVLKTVIYLAKDFLFNSINALPLGPYATLRCTMARLPSVSDTFTAVDVYIDVEVPGQGILSIPDSASSINPPCLANFKSCQSFHPELFNIVLSVLAPKEPQELSCTPDKFSGADELRSAILALVLSKNQGIVSAGVLNIRISTEANPAIVFGPNGIVITAALKVEFFIRNADGSTYFVLVMRSRVTLSAVLSFVNGKVIFMASITGNALELISSDAGASDDVSSLESHCANLLGETFLPVFNGRLAVGLPVFPIFSTVSINPTFQFLEGALVACS
ncbi:BPI fold-containing family B member 3 [Pogona vitticeps]